MEKKDKQENLVSRYTSVKEVIFGGIDGGPVYKFNCLTGEFSIYKEPPFVPKKIYDWLDRYKAKGSIIDWK